MQIKNGNNSILIFVINYLFEWMKVLFIALFSVLILSQTVICAEKDYTDFVKYLQ